MADKNELRDIAVGVLIYGGSTLVKIAAVATLSATGLINPGVLRYASKCAGFTLKSAQDRAWREYQKTGNVMQALETLYDGVFSSS
jgi:hypothetical protein